MADIIASVIFMIVGILSSTGALLNSDWLLDSQQTKFISNLVGRNGSRIFYAVLGIGCIIAGGILLYGKI